jgi:vacuolar-type H+-ATPase subunit I/STV1
MELSAFQISKIELIAEYESAVMELYWVYSEKFPEHKTFWIDMADDERKNVEWIRSTIERIKANKIDYNRDRFNIEAIRISMNFIKTQTREALDKPVSLQTALSNAASIEDSLAKKKFFEIIKDDNQEARLLYQRFAAENQKHREKLNQFRQRFK